jgi:hypothetical protein
MTTTHEPGPHDAKGAPSSKNAGTGAWRYGLCLVVAGMLASLAMVQTFGGNVSAATLEEAEPASTLPIDPTTQTPLPEVAAAVPLL